MGNIRKEVASIVPNYAWVILLVVYLATLAAPLNQSKVPPLLPILIDSFHLNLSQAGMLMSVFAISGFILAIPAGITINMLGSKVIGLVALVTLSIGAVLGTESTTILQFLTSRLIEGVGFGLLAVVAPAIIAMWFPRHRRGFPLGIWATWVPVGRLLMLLIAPIIATSLDWQAVWWIGAGYTLFVLALFGLFIRRPPTLADNQGGEKPAPWVKALANREIWLLGLVFCCFSFTLMSLGTFFPTFLSQVRGYSLTQASSIYSLQMVAVLISAPLAGRISDKIGSRKLVFSVPFLIIAVMMLLPFKVIGWQLFTYMILLGLVIGAIPTATFAAASEVMSDSRLAGLAFGVVILGQNLGVIIGPVLFGNLVENIGWTAAGYCFIPVCILGFVIGWNVRVR
jgi:MFS family permease